MTFFEHIYTFDFDKLNKELGLKGLIVDLEIKYGGEIRFAYQSVPYLEERVKYVLLYLRIE